MHINVLPLSTLKFLFHDTSSELLLPNCAKSDEQTASTMRLGQFESTILESATCSTQIPSGEGALRSNVDVLLHAGGLIWACDFCPRPSGSAAELLAASVHPADVSRHKVGQTVHGLGAVQIWQVPHASPEAPSAPSAAPPHLAMCIVHDGQVTWDVKWCPDPRLVYASTLTASEDLVRAPPVEDPSAAASAPGKRAGKRARMANANVTKSSADPADVPALSTHIAAELHSGTATVPSIGVLAFISGDAFVQVVSVPEPSRLVAPAGAPRISGADIAEEGGHEGASSSTLALTLDCLHKISREMLGGSMPCTLEWQRSGAPQHAAAAEGSASGRNDNDGASAGANSRLGIKLLVGCHDGVVSGWRIPGGPLHQLQGLFHVK